MTKHKINSPYSTLALFLLIAVTFTIYSKTLSGSFIWDDHHFVLKNPSIQSVKEIPNYFLSKDSFASLGEFYIYRPLRNISYLIDYLAFGMEPSGFRFINLLLHIQNILILSYLVRLITSSWLVAIITASFFALHPIQTETVSWIKSRDDLLAAFFFMLSLTLHIKSRAESRNLYHWASVFTFGLALLSKEIAVTLPFIIIACDLCLPSKKEGKKSYHPYFYLLMLYIILRTVVLGQVAQTEYWGGSFLSSTYTALTGIVYYIKLILFPINLCADYLMFPISYSLLDPYVIGAIAVLILFVLVIYFSYVKGWKVFSFSILWFFITLLPVSNIVPIKIIIAERFLYLPSVGLFIGGAILLKKFFDKFETDGKGLKKVLFVIIPVIFILLSAMTVDRNRIWVESQAFWLDVADKYPKNTRAWHNLASTYHNQQMFPEAISLYKKALMMDYHSPETHYQLGRIYRAIGDNAKALDAFSEALKDDPENADINYEVGILSQKKGMSSEAISRYNQAIQKNANHEKSIYELGILYMQEKKFELASIQFKKILILTPDDPMAAGFLHFCEQNL